MPEAELIRPIKKTVGKQFNDGKPGPGRPPGVPNKLTTTVKDAIARAFDEEGGVDYLRQVARDDPKTFCTLLGKLLPMQVDTNGDDQVVVKIQYESRTDNGDS